MFKSQRASKSDSISNGCRAGMITTTHTCEPSMQLQRFLFDQLWDQGVRHIFGIPAILFSISTNRSKPIGVFSSSG